MKYRPKPHWVGQLFVDMEYTQEEILSHFMPIDEPEEIAVIQKIDLAGIAGNVRYLDEKLLGKLNQVIDAVNALRRKE